jgi:hypothetical protein
MNQKKIKCKSTFKIFCEGTIKGKLLYKNGVHDFKHFGLPVFTSNMMPNINIDTGVKRRFRCYNHTSLFTSDKSKVDEKKNIYLLDMDVIDNIVNDGLLNTWIDILAKYANKWIKGDEIPIPKSFQEATEEVVDANDNIKDFIDVKLTITNNTVGKIDRIGKNEMIELYKEMYPNRGMNHQILKMSLVERGISWNKEIRGKDGIKGCYVNVIQKNNKEKSEKVDNFYEEENKRLKKIIEELENKLKEFENDNGEKTIKSIIENETKKLNIKNEQHNKIKLTPFESFKKITDDNIKVITDIKKTNKSEDFEELEELEKKLEVTKNDKKENSKIKKKILKRYDVIEIPDDIEIEL